MKKAKYINSENTFVQIIDDETGYNISGPIYRLQKELEGLTIAEFETLDELKKASKQKANDLYSSIENHFLIEANNRVYNFDISKKLDFFAKFMMQSEVDFLDWDDYSNETVHHDKQMTANIIQSADTFLRALFNAKKADKLACESGDYSLANLTAIKAQQDTLRGGE